MKKFVAGLCLLAIVSAIALPSLAEQPSHGNSPRLISCSLKPLPASSRHHLNAAPHIRIREGTSLNWSGYAAVSGTLTSPATDAVTAAAGYWIVPSVTGAAGQYSALWVGIDGYADGSVEQLGTEQDVVSVRQGRKVVTTAQQNYTWFEMYPAGSFEITGFPTDVGDVIGAGVTYAGANVFTLAITNVTRNVYYVVPVSYTTSAKAQRSSAEWIAEAPSSGKVLPLADFGTVAFGECSATINGHAGAISNFTYDAMNMETAKGVVKAAVSPLTDNGTSFTATWHHD